MNLRKVYDFKDELFRMAFDFLSNEDYSRLNLVGQKFYTKLYDIVPEKRHDVAAQLIIHICSGSHLKNEAQNALTGNICHSRWHLGNLVNMTLRSALEKIEPRKLKEQMAYLQGMLKMECWRFDINIVRKGALQSHCGF